mmetsp:Transcript_29531/g.63936  ORF Transcript_29531/g.63936 Transcript_29531/m.63936 type:complete len:207 (+) Transcript_29531:1132-1752(+)
MGSCCEMVARAVSSRRRSLDRAETWDEPTGVLEVFGRTLRFWAGERAVLEVVVLMLALALGLAEAAPPPEELLDSPVIGCDEPRTAALPWRRLRSGAALLLLLVLVLLLLLSVAAVVLVGRIEVAAGDGVGVGNVALLSCSGSRAAFSAAFFSPSSFSRSRHRDSNPSMRASWCAMTCAILDGGKTSSPSSAAEGAVDCPSESWRH